MSRIQLLGNAGSSTGTSITSNASANTPGTRVGWVQLSAAIDRITLQVRPQVGAGRRMKLLLYTGGTGSSGSGETVYQVIPYLDASIANIVDIPLRLSLPAGTWVSWALQDDTGSGQVVASGQGHIANPALARGAATAGTVLTDQGGSDAFVSLAASAVTANTWTGAAGNVTASSPARFNLLNVCLRDNNATTAADGLFRLLINGVEDPGYIYRKLTNNGRFEVWYEIVADVEIGDEVSLEIRSSSTTTIHSQFAVIGFLVPEALVTTEDDMQFDSRALNAASQTLRVDLVDTAGNPITGLDHTDVTCHASIDAAAPSAVSLVAGTVGTYVTRGFIEIDATDLPGAYAFSPATLPASGARIDYTFRGAAIRKAVLRVDLVGSDPRLAALNEGDIADEVNRRVIAILKSLKRTGTNGNGGLSFTGPDGAESTALATEPNAEPVLEFDTAS